MGLDWTPEQQRRFARVQPRSGPDRAERLPVRRRQWPFTRSINDILPGWPTGGDLFDSETSLLASRSRGTILRMTETSATQITQTLVLPYLNHAVRMYEQKYASRGDIDAAMRFGCGYPRGPLTTLDDLGLDTVRDALAARYAETGDNLHKPADLLETLVAEGRTGKAAGVASTPTPTARPSPLTTRPRRPTTSRSSARRSARSAWSAPARWPRASSRSSPRAGYDVVFVGRGDEQGRRRDRRDHQGPGSLTRRRR